MAATNKPRRSFDPHGRVCAGSCGQWKPWAEFSPSPGGLNDRRARCKGCEAKRMSAYRESDPEAWKRRQFELGLWRKFRITLGQFEKLEAEQGGVCALCGEPETRVATGVNASGVTVQRLSVDHDHACCPRLPACGRCVRGLLCCRCNQFVGRLEGSHGRLVLSRLRGYMQQRPFAGEGSA